FKGVPAPMLVHEVGEVGVAPLTAPGSSTKVQRELPWWRSPGALALEAALMLLTLGSVLYIASRPQPAIAFGERDWVVVGDLRNLTGDGELSEALETAFRISLEQSRYVNVLSDLKVRDTLARMQREAEGIIVDREVGSEIALREGARALILPTVADVGGRVRVSAEVIDPSTQTTVYAESADGVGIASTLGSIDTVTHHLRHRLGEALAAIDQDSMPLPQVTTDDVQALKWFAQAEESFRSGRYAEAGERYRRAVAIDPGFAMAHMGLARTFVSADDLQTASLHMTAAASDRDRLPAREQLYIDAWLASLGNIDGALQKWKLLMQMYPDMPAGHYNYALFAYQWAGRYEEAQEVVIGAADARYPLQGAARYLQGTIALARDRMDEAMEAFSESSKLGVRNHGWNAAWAMASTRDFEAAQRRLDEGTATGIAAGDALGVHSEVTFALDRGDLDGALVRAESFVADASAPDLARDTLALTAMMLRVLGQDTTAWASSASAYCRGEYERRNQVPPTGHAALAFGLATCGYVLAGTRFADEAPALVDSAVSLNRSLGYSTIEDAIAMATAERLRLAGQPEDAVRVLTDRIDGGELYGVHVVLLEALADAGESEAAVEQADWLAGHRGRAYGEWNSQHALQAWNVAHSNLAWLRAAELEAGRGRPAQALDRFEEFLRIWPESSRPEPIGARVRAVRERLQPSSL
ncbi:MAG TPA: putative peptide modification system cyclase, partial [Xanthomonadaceae bacterium]|nr:putative peptide modification system cyclase [Xanthomonadaceae bacterium]